MPAFHVGPSGAKTTAFKEIARVLRFGFNSTHPVVILFIYLLCFYVLLLTLRVSPWLSAIGAIAFALSSYNLIILQPGHISKAYAIALYGSRGGGNSFTLPGKVYTGSTHFHAWTGY